MSEGKRAVRSQSLEFIRRCDKRQAGVVGNLLTNSLAN